jgi:hypothetical protein
MSIAKKKQEARGEDRRKEGSTDERRREQTKGGWIQDSGNGTEGKGDIGGHENAKGKEGNGHGEDDMGKKEAEGEGQR